MPPTFVVGDLWDEVERADMLLVTTNATLRHADRALVMGRGAAAQAAARWPEAPHWLGIEITELGPEFWMYHDGQRARFPYWLVFTYHLPVPPRPSGLPLCFGAFQVKYHFKEAAEPELIAQSALRLKEVIETGYDPALPPRVAMNFPGTGWGQLRRETVLPLLDVLPPCVHIYEYGKGR